MISHLRTNPLGILARTLFFAVVAVEAYRLGLAVGVLL